MQDPLSRIYRLKIVLLALASSAIGLALLVIARWPGTLPDWMRYLPVSELGSTLFITGAFVVAYDYLDGRDKERREDERIRRLLRESAPALRDAVVQGFALEPDDLKRVATPQLLDEIATNALGLRLGDQQFAAEIYADLRDQAIRAPERWYDVRIKVRLAAVAESERDTSPLFDALIEWEYTTVPRHPVQRFACVSDRDEYYDLTTDIPATSTWFMTPRPGLDASSTDCFQLVYFAVDGEERAIRRSTRRSGQTYSATIGEELVRAGKPIRVNHIYRVRTTQSGHRLYIELTQPSRDVSINIDYNQTSISRLSATELVSSAQRARVVQLPESTSNRAITMDLPGWLLPRAGVAFTWTLASEEPGAAPTPVAIPGQTKAAGSRAQTSRHRS